MKYAILFMLSFVATADPYDLTLDPLDTPRRDETLLPAPMTDKYFGGYNTPSVVVPVQPGTGPSYIGRDQIMTDHQYCSRSAVDGALVCYGH